MPSIEELQLLNYVLESKKWTVVEHYGLGEEHFPIHSHVFGYIRDFHRNTGQVPTLESVLNNYKEFERVEIEHVEQVVKALQEDKLHRMVRPVLKNAATKVGNKQSYEAIQELHEETAKLLKGHSTQNKGYSYTENAEKRKNKYLSIHGRAKDQIIGYSTGFAPLDEATNGLVYGEEETDYFLVLAPSNMGKTLITSFMFQSPWSSTPASDYPAYFALEQHASEIARNFDNVLAGVSSLAMQRGTMSGEERDKYVFYLDSLRQRRKDMMIYDVSSNGGKPYTVDEMKRILEREGHNRFALDQVSKVRVPNSFGANMDLRTRLYSVSAEIRQMILDTEKPGYIVSQATREAAKKAKKEIETSSVDGEDIGETYSIYQDASKGISVVKVNKNTFRIQVIKNRGNDNSLNFLVRYQFETGIVGVLNGAGDQHW